MMPDDPFSYRRVFQLSLSYGGVVFLLLCWSPLRELMSAEANAERLRECAGAIGALVPVAMALSAVVAGGVRRLLCSFRSISRRFLASVFLLGTFWQLPLSLCIAAAAADHEPNAWLLPLYFSAAALVAAAALTLTLWCYKRKIDSTAAHE